MPNFVWWFRQGRALSHLLNSLTPGGSPNISLSGRTYLKARLGTKWAVWLEPQIDRLFFWQERHCRRAWLGDVAFAREVFYNDESIRPLL